MKLLTLIRGRDSSLSFLLSLIYGLLVSVMFMYWGTRVLGFTTFCVVALALMSQSFSSSFNIIFSLRSLSSFMLLLRVVLCILSLISTPRSKSFSYQCTIRLLGAFLILAFSSSNIVNFYVWFEASLVPTLILIIC